MVLAADFLGLLCRLFTGRTVIGQREALCVLDREGSIAASTRWWNIFRYLWLERLQAKKWRSEVYKVPGKNTSSKVPYITAIFYLLLSQGAPFLFLHVQIDLFFKYYPKRLGQVLFVDAPFVFQPGWAMIKPWVGKYAALVRYFLYIIRLCIYETVLSCMSGWHWLASSIQTLRWWKFSSRMLVNSLKSWNAHWIYVFFAGSILLCGRSAKRLLHSWYDSRQLQRLAEYSVHIDYLQLSVPWNSTKRVEFRRGTRRGKREDCISLWIF